MPLPYLTTEFPGIGGVIKQRAEDFFVQELPLYEPSGEGEHVYCEVQKAHLTTFEAIDRLAAALKVPQRDIGYAGMKDARAVTRQLFSIRGTTEQAVMNLRLSNMQVQWAARHANKLRVGHLRANRFAIKVREVDPTAVVRLRPAVDVMVRRGLPNYFGEQRFGQRANNDQLGAALIRGDNLGVLKLLLGAPNRVLDRDPRVLEARQKFDAHDNEASMHLWPRKCGMERRILARLMKTHKPAAAVRAIDERLRRLWVSALQSKIFNQVLAKRLPHLDQLMDGDLAYKHDNGACFRVEQAATEQPRCEAFEVSPTGPLVGYRMTEPAGEPLLMEQAILAAHELKLTDFRNEKERVKGARRPLRVRPEEVQLEGGVDEHGSFVTVAFTLPAGSFATVLLRELMKSGGGDVEPEAAGGDDEAAAEGGDEAEAADAMAGGGLAESGDAGGNP